MNSGDFLLADEEFHRRMVALARNKELSAFMEVVTRRIHIARHIDIQQSSWNAKAFDAHFEVLDLMLARKQEEALACLTEHIDMSLKRAVEITKEMVAKFFLVGSASGAELADGAAGGLGQPERTGLRTRSDASQTAAAQTG
jgi:hypothetical protein